MFGNGAAEGVATGLHSCWASVRMWAQIYFSATRGLRTLTSNSVDASFAAVVVEVWMGFPLDNPLKSLNSTPEVSVEWNELVSSAKDRYMWSRRQ